MTDREDLERDGFCVVRNFYDQMEVEAVFGQITQLVHLAATCGGERRTGSMFEPAPAVYEGAKQVPALYRMLSSPKSMELIQDLRPGFMAGIAEGGIQVRADMPNDAKWATSWHADGVFQGRSVNGLTFWMPLLPVSPDMGPMQICVGSHKAGPLPIHNVGPGEHGRSRSYTWEIVGVDDVIAKYDVVAPLTGPGDVIVMDYATVHRSGQNVSAVPRWSCLWRYFDFRDKSMGWRRPSAFGPMAA